MSETPKESPQEEEVQYISVQQAREIAKRLKVEHKEILDLLADS